MNKKILTALALGGMIAGVANAADIRYKANGDWGATTNSTGDANGWRSPTMPTTADRGILNWGGATVTVTGSEAIGEVRVGQDEVGNLVVAGGGTLDIGNGAYDGRLTLGQGNNPAGTGSLTINSGGTVTVEDILFNGNKANGTADISGTLNVGSHLWTGWNTGITGTYNIYDGGVLNVSGQLGLDWQNNGGIGLININDGGTVNLSQIAGGGASINGSSLITIFGSGVLTKTGNFESLIQNDYVNTGKIVGDGGATVSVTYDDLNDKTIVAIPEPATMGLFAAFGGAIVFLRRFRI